MGSWWFQWPDQGYTIDVWGNVWLLSAFLFRILTYLRIPSDQQAGRAWAFVYRGAQTLEEKAEIGAHSAHSTLHPQVEM